MQATLQAKVSDESLYPIFDAIAELYGPAERRFCDDLGNFKTALGVARELAHLPPGAPAVWLSRRP